MAFDLKTDLLFKDLNDDESANEPYFDAADSDNDLTDIFDLADHVRENSETDDIFKFSLIFSNLCFHFSLSG